MDPKRCQVVGLNSNYLSRTGTLYHIQIEDRGPILDRASEEHVRRVNTIVYANYGEPNARIVYGADRDYRDIRTQEHNRFIEQKIQEVAAETRLLIEEKELRIVARIKRSLRDYHQTKANGAKKEFEEANAVYPFLFSRAFRELKQEREEALPAAVDANGADTVYPLDNELRERVIEIERIVGDLNADVEVLKAEGSADDILLQTCRKLVARAQESLRGDAGAEFNLRRLDMTRSSLITTWKQVRSRFKKQA